MYFLADASAASYPSVDTVIILGLGTVFVGLICIIALVSLMGMIVRKAEKKVTEPVENKAAAAVTGADAPIENRGEIAAAIAAVVAEELGCDISRIRIHSIKRI